MQTLVDLSLVSFQTYNTLRLIRDPEPKEQQLKQSIKWWAIFGLFSLGEIAFNSDGIPLWWIAKGGVLGAMYHPVLSENIMNLTLDYTQVAEKYTKETFNSVLEKIKAKTKTEGDEGYLSGIWSATKKYVPFL